MITMFLHTDIYPNTDHGYTEIDWFWFKERGKTISPIMPYGGYTERLLHLPEDDPDRDYFGNLIEYYTKEKNIKKW